MVFYCSNKKKHKKVNNIEEDSNMVGTNMNNIEFKFPRQVLKAVYLDAEVGKGNEEAKNYLLNLFESIDSIVLYRSHIVIKASPNKKIKGFKHIFHNNTRLGKEYYVSQFKEHFKSCKYFMEKFNLKLYEYNHHGFFGYSLSKENPNNSFPFEGWHMPNTKNLNFKEINEISHDVDGKFICYDNKLSKFTIGEEENNPNLKVFSKLDNIFDIIRESAGKDNKYRSIYVKMLKDKIEDIFSNSKRENPCVAIAFNVSEGYLPKIVEWNYDKQNPCFEKSTFALYFKDKKLENIKSSDIRNCSQIIESVRISSYLGFSNNFNRYLADIMRKDLGVEKIDNPYNIIKSSK